MSATAQTVVPQSALVPSGRYYTDLIGGGIGNVVVMTDGGSDPGVGLASGRNDDGFSGPINLGFTFNFFGTAYTQFFANNNGNISFGAGIPDFVPTGPTGAASPVISPHFADVDTRGAGSGVLHLRNASPNEVILTWDSVGYCSEHTDKLDSFQLVVRGPGFATPSGEGTIGFFYKAMPWIGTDSSTTAAVGFGDGAGQGSSRRLQHGDDQRGVGQPLHLVRHQNLVVVPSPVPEPESYTLMLAGLAAVGAVARRRKAPRAA